MVKPCSLRLEVQASMSSGTLASEWYLPSVVCCLSSMHIIDKKSIAWLTKHLWLLPHISMPEDHNFLVAPRVLLELDHDSWIMLPLFSVWNSLFFAIKDQQGFNARLTIGKCGQLHGTLCLIMTFTCRSSPY